MHLLWTVAPKDPLKSIYLNLNPEITGFLDVGTLKFIRMNS